ncbi:MAG TPA: 2,3-bisphosphoglycerate-independent phosphoglycerate mutase [Solirubrobacteraceae bacterium]|nr:2,3-bisphosphoglycerate-independent phosphoglycerate mutase [Solirubrobacteraceae bacterium]
MTPVFPSVALVVLDGWGLAPRGPGNAVAQAHTPVFDALWQRYPHTQLITCGEAVGLPPGQMGNSEVGHLNLGAGAVVEQDLVRIGRAAREGAFATNAVLREAFTAAERVHLIGLCSAGGVHSGPEHLRALIDLGARLEVPDLVIHAFTDGRDTSPAHGIEFMRDVVDWCRTGTGRVASVVGRYYAMDRDARWERTQCAYDLLVRGRGEHEAHSPEEALSFAYERGETDEFVTATCVGEREGTIRPGDSVVAFNFRPDRMRQLVEMLGDHVAHLATLTEYNEHWTFPVAFPPARPEVNLPRVLAQVGARQLHVAETEKYPHVTYFFGGGEEDPQHGERRELVASPRDVPTYDHKPEMSAHEAAAVFVDAWREDEPRFGIINFANPDMVGHTGSIPAAVTAVETVDACLGEVVEAVHTAGGACIITADHGNADEMLGTDGSPATTHSLNPVPLVITAEGLAVDGHGGVLADVAPTALALLGIDQPTEMTGRSLLC